VLRASAHEIESHVALANSRDRLHRGGEQEGVAHHKCDVSPAAPGSGSELLHRGGESDYVGQRDAHATARNKRIDDRLGQKNCHRISSPLLSRPYEPLELTTANEKTPPLSSGAKSWDFRQCRGRCSPIADGSARKINEKFRRMRPARFTEKAPHEAGPVGSDEPQEGVSVCYRGLPASSMAGGVSG
jgi:hypothetical protein